MCVIDVIFGCCKEKGDCDDKNVCIEDFCNVVDGICSNMVIEGCCVVDSDCDDGNVCMIDLCKDNVCVVFIIKSCCMDDV